MDRQDPSPLRTWEFYGRELRVVQGDQSKGEPGLVGEVWINGVREGRALFGPAITEAKAIELTEKHAAAMRPNLTRG